MLSGKGFEGEHCAVLDVRRAKDRKISLALKLVQTGLAKIDRKLV
jgi:hypothetical protein